MEFAELAAMAGGHAEARAIQVALKLGIFELLAEGPLDASAMAYSLHLDPRATALLANAIAALGLLGVAEGRYDLTDSARRFLLKSSAEYLGGMILFDEAIFQDWARLEDSIRTGGPARTPDMFQANAADTERFIRAMDSLTRARGDAAWVAENVDFGDIATVADLGGGPGTYLAAILRRRPAMRGAIWDLPATLEVARRVIAEREREVAARIDLVEVDYLKARLPDGAGTIFMSNIIHSEDESANAGLMAKCFEALPQGGMIVIKDHVMNRELTEPRAGAVFSLYLLLMTRGRDYSFDEIGGWLTAAGFTGVTLQTLPSPPFTSSLVTARKP
ncbi:MAG: methyltransferase [Candidatus Binataceae bacterium]